MTSQHYQTRTLKIEFHPKPQQRQLLYGMMRSSAMIYNLLIDHLAYKQSAYKQAREEYPDQPAWEVDPYVDIRRKGWADELIITLITQQSSIYPRQLVNKPAKQGKDKGKERLVVATEKNAKPDYGIPAQSKVVLTQDFEANIASYFTHRKNGDTNAQLPRRYKGLHTLFFTNQLVKRSGDRLILGAKPYVLKLRVPELLNISIDGDVKITRSRSGRFCLHITRKLPVEPNPELIEVAAVDFGQKRAMVLALKDGTTATISGKNICALKRERDGRYRGINRKRSRVLKGQIRQYLSPDEKATYRELQERDNERQRQGLKRRGSDIKYAFRIIRQRRKDLGLKKRSRREMRLLRSQHKAADYYRVRLTYANHCVTRAAVNWCVENKVGKVYVGDLKTLPKTRKKGKRRIKQVGRNNLWEMPTQVKYLDEKLLLAGGEGTETASEARSSQVCPNCGRRHKPRNRVYYCNPRKGGCGWLGDRDGVGGCNFLSSVLYGACGAIKPAQNRTLRLAPAIRQGLRMPTPDGSAVCEPAEDSAKGYKSSDLQESAVVADSVAPRTDRNPATSGKTQARGGMGVLATSDPSELVTPVVSSQLAKTGVDRPKRRSLKRLPEDHIQLELWESE
ncbi:transposase [Leptolyngbya sp. FACHB-541]|uniref:zinc ribbon domain-containing protein n=1 Tax=Leptolyngbya sp. FACHB-541 TaxID=2692810 RepID=UPI0016867FC5|nr:zinc ribbon domain-containing protein [Leptolyngbya sp. FACHB-541]MBD1995206.1 transposase [Leptolyngbya sp. FACHB-541]